MWKVGGNIQDGCPRPGTTLQNTTICTEAVMNEQAETLISGYKRNPILARERILGSWSARHSPDLY